MLVRQLAKCKGSATVSLMGLGFGKPFSSLHVCLFISGVRASRLTPWDESPSSAGERGKESNLLGISSLHRTVFYFQPKPCEISWAAKSN